MTAFARIVSADSHVLEPPDLWTGRLPMVHRPMAPRIVESSVRGVCLIGPGIPAVGLTDATSPATRLVGHRVGLDALLRGGSEVPARLEDSDADGVAAEILYPTAGLMLHGMPDGRLRRACFTVYNDWLAEMCAQAPDRLFGLALLDVEDAGAAVEELDRAHAMGFVGGLIPGRPPTGHYAEPRFHPLWQFASRRRLPISIHAFSERDPADTLGSGLDLVAAMDPIFPMHRTMALLAVGGVLARFPDLRLVSSEFDAGWVPYLYERLDRLADRCGLPAVADAVLDPPSTYLRRQVSYGFQRDPVAIELRARIGPGALLWGSDYPHAASFWPGSVKMLEDLLADVADDERDAIVGGNAIALYGLEAALPA